MMEGKLAIERFLGGWRVHTKCGFLEQYRLRTSEAEGLYQPTLQLDWMRLITPEISLITWPRSKFEQGWKFETHEFGCSLYKLVLFQPGFPDLLIRWFADPPIHLPNDLQDFHFFCSHYLDGCAFHLPFLLPLRPLLCIASLSALSLQSSTSHFIHTIVKTQVSPTANRCIFFPLGLTGSKECFINKFYGRAVYLVMCVRIGVICSMFCVIGKIWLECF